MSKIQKITDPVMKIENFNSFTVLGDPGCDGLGADIMSMFEISIKKSQGDIIIVAGDIVPIGTPNYYKQVSSLIEGSSSKPVYMLCGNHDTGSYEDSYGLPEYALYDDNTLIVVLNNASGKFTKESLDLLKMALNMYSRKNIVLMMHIPPVNNITKKAVNTDEWEKVQEIIKLSKCKENIKYIVAGHVHSYFEDDLDGTILIVTGGAGARIATMDNVDTPYNHYVEFYYDENKVLRHKKIDLELQMPIGYNDETLDKMLDTAFTKECIAHVKYRLLADDARKRGMVNLARLYEAVSSAEFIHARNHYYTAGKLKEPIEGLTESIDQEQDEISKMYPEFIKYAKEKGYPLPVSTLSDAMEAEKTHFYLFSMAEEVVKENKDIKSINYYTCTSCGYTFAADDAPGRCPVCGAPFDKIKKEL